MLNELLKEYRDILGLSQNQIAEKLNISRNSVYNYETGERTPDIETLIKYADIFNTSTDHLLGRTPYRNPTVEQLIKLVETGNQLQFQLNADGTISLPSNEDIIPIIEKFYNVLNSSIGTRALEKLETLLDAMLNFKYSINEVVHPTDMNKELNHETYMYLRVLEAIIAAKKTPDSKFPIVPPEAIGKTRYDQKDINDCISSLCAWLNLYASSYINDFKNKE